MFVSTHFLRVRVLIPVIALAWLVSAITPVAARQSGTDVDRAIDGILQSTCAANAPGVAIIAASSGKTVYRGARGMANLELDVALTPDHVFRLGSITKQFTAAAIMILVEQGKLNLDDEITEFLPDYPVRGQTITVEHLLTHTSGIKSYTNIPGWMLIRVQETMTVNQLIRGFRDEPMEFTPGEKFNYNNSGYVLLGAIIEEVSGDSYADFIRKNIFDPLDMHDSYYGSRGRIIPGRTSGYSGSADRSRNARYLSMTQPYAAGSLLSTVDDMAKWNAALFSGEVVRKESLEQMITPFELPDGTSTGYGFGLGTGDVRGHLAIQHGGGIFGFSTYGVYLPDDDVYVAVLSNTDGGSVDPGRLANQVAALIVGDPFPTFEAITLKPKQLEKFVGVYRIDDQATRTVTVRDGKLFTQRNGGQLMEATPSSERAFFYQSSLSHFEFVTNDQSETTGMKMYQDGSQDAEVAHKTDEKPVERIVADVDPELYDNYVGAYQLGPGFVLTVTRTGNRIMTQATGQPKVEIFPESEKRFFLKVVDAQLTFVCEEDGIATAVVLNQGGGEVTGKRIK